MASSVQFLVAPSGVPIEEALKQVALLTRTLADREDAGLPDEEVLASLQQLQGSFRTFSTATEAAASAGPGETVLPYDLDALWDAFDAEWERRGSISTARPS